MRKKLIFQFDPNQNYQLDAIQSVVDLFEGVPFQEQKEILSGVDVVSNFPPDEELDEFLLLENLQAVQERNNELKRGSELEIATELEMDDGLVLEKTGFDSVRVPHFTVEMETGTGKTYVYLRTIHELRKRYGFTKFIIVVPSVAIYQGVTKSIEITKDHFRQLYDNQVIHTISYDGGRMNDVHIFASNTELTAMIMTIDSFNKASNNFYKHTEKLPGEWKPYQYVQATRPIVILDEAHNYTSVKYKEAIRTLKPLFVLRYSATPKEMPNLVYRLTPLDAFRNNLVKQIEVVGVSELGSFGDKVLRLVEVKRNSTKTLEAEVRAMAMDGGVLVEKKIVLKQGDDLFAKTKNPDYQGFKVANIRFGKKEEEQQVEFENGVTLSATDAVLAKEVIFKAQIERTIVEHIEKQKRLKDQGIKVLSLFFIDRVKNYTSEDGPIRRLFDEAFERLKHRYEGFKNLSAYEVREGYFAKPKADAPDEEAVDTNGSTKEQKEMEKRAFELIMKNKERLLSFDEPVCFIFAHSALKEGWDNPNVFQICTLNQTKSTIRKRQEIGRGLRLAVDQEGRRVDDFGVNVLTVIANESYESFVAGLQNEYLEDGTSAPPKPKKPEQGKVKRNDRLFQSKEFHNFWNKLNRRMRYKINIDTEKLIQDCVARLNKAKFPTPLLEISKGDFVIAEYSLSLVEVQGGTARIRLQMEDTQGNTEDQLFTVKEKDDLKKITRNELLRGFKVLRIGEQYGEPFVKFDNEIIVRRFEPHTFKAKRAVKVQKRIETAEKSFYPIPDFITRVAEETSLTKKTVLEIFKRMNKEQKEKIFYHPEGWINEFLSQIRIALSDHIVDNIDFEFVNDKAVYDVEDLFPEVVRQPQRELIEAGEAGLYDKVQIDSEVERGFIQKLVIPDAEKGNTILFFKFPPKFKIRLPKIIGNYNPDWGIVRKTPDGLKLELVRETKGGLNLDELRFPKEKRKILCAEKYFQKMGINYRVVKDDTYNWYEKGYVTDPLKLES